MSNKYDYDEMSDNDILATIDEEYIKLMDESIKMIERRAEAIRLSDLPKLNPLILTNSRIEPHRRQMFDIDAEGFESDDVNVLSPSAFDFINYEIDDASDSGIDILS